MRHSAPSTPQPVGLSAHPPASDPVSVPDPTSVPADTVDYPCSDGQPMAESQLHAECIMYVCKALQWHFEQHHAADRYTSAAPAGAGHGAYVGANMFLYYERGNREAVVAPDVFVVRGIPVHLRDSYQLWREPKGPDFVLEVTSKSTSDTDLVDKRALYASLGVEEYFLYDPRGEYLTPPLRGYRLEGDGYRRLTGVSRLPGGGPSLYSTVLGLALRDERESQRLRLHDPATGRDLRTYRESETHAAQETAARRTAEAHAAQEAAARRAAEARVEQEQARNAELEARLRAFDDASGSHG